MHYLFSGILNYYALQWKRKERYCEWIEYARKDKVELLLV